MRWKNQSQEFQILIIVASNEPMTDKETSALGGLSVFLREAAAPYIVKRLRREFDQETYKYVQSKQCHFPWSLFTPVFRKII